MKTKVKLIKKEDRNAPESPIGADASPNPKEWSMAVKSGISEFQKDRDVESLEGFDSLFKRAKALTSEAKTSADDGRKQIAATPGGCSLRLQPSA
jgi:hypothetical protein